MITTKKLVISALLIALAVVLTRVLAINTLTVKIGFGFVPIIVAALLYGPLYTGVIYAISDIIGTLMFPAGAYNPFLTISFFLMGVMYGVFLYPSLPVSRGLHRFGSFLGRKLRLSETGCSALSEIVPAFITGTLLSLVFSLVLNTILIHVFFRVSYAILIPSRGIQVALLIPLHTAVIPLVSTKVIPQIKKAKA